MTYEEIQKAVNEISKMMTDRGISHYSCNLTINANGEPYFYIASYDKIFDGTDSRVVRGEAPEEIIEGAKAAVRAIPNKEDRNKQAFMAELASVIDKGKDLGIDVEFLNPLVSQMKKLSENIITDKRGN